MSKWFQVSLLLIMSIVFSSVFVSAGTQLNIPSCWVLSKTGVSTDSNCDGIFDQAQNALSLGGFNSSYFLNINDNVSIWNGINSKLNITDQRYNDTSSINAEILNRISNDSYLQSLITTSSYNDTNLSNRITSVNSSLSTEILNRISNDSYLQSLITTSSYNDTNLSNRITSVNASLSNEIIDRKAADLQINSTLNSIGNWTNDKVNYYLNSNPYNFYNSSSIPSYALQSSLLSVGNWTNDKTNYVLTTSLTSIGNWSADKSSYNTTTQNYNIFLNISDQRYNNSVAINGEITNRQTNDTYLQNQINNISVGVYNDTTLNNRITSVNNSLTNEISARQSIGNWTNDKSSYNTSAQLNNIYLNQSDQRYNDSALANQKAFPGTCASGFVVQNTTTSGVQCINMSVGGSGSVTSIATTNPINGGTITSTGTLSFNESWADSRWNDTTAITTANTSMKNYVDTTFYLKTNPNNYYNSTSIPAYALQTSLTSIGNWTNDKTSYNTTAQNYNIFLNITDQRYNDSTAITNVQNSVTSNASKLSSIGNWTNDKSSYTTTANLPTYSNGTSNLTMSQVVSGVGNYSASASSIYTNITNSQSAITSIGNWTNDKTSYNTTAQNYNIFLNITDQRYNDSTAITNVQTSVTGNASSLTNEITSRISNDSLKVDKSFTITTTGPLFGSSNLTNNFTIYMTQSNNTIGGYLSSVDWNTFNNKFNVSDQRYNESSIITLVNNSLINLNTSFWNQNTITREPTGFVDRTTSTISFDNTTRNFTLVGTYDYYINGTKYTHSNDSVIVSNNTGINYIYYNNGVIVQSITPWTFKSYAQIATIYWNNITKNSLVSDERHGLTMDWATHEYLHETLGARYVSGFVGQWNDTSFNISSGEFYDEDLEFTPSNQTRCDVIYRNGSLTTWVDNTTQYYFKNATNMYYDNNGVLTAMSNNDYMAIWFYVSNDANTPIYCILGQRTDTTLANAIANNVPSTMSFGSLPLPELKSLYRVIIRNDATPFEVTGTVDYRATSSVASGNFVATSHGTLSGLSADDHPQYLLRTDATVYNDTVAINQVQSNLNGNISILTSIGNWTNDKTSYNTTAQNYNIFLNITDQRYNDSTAITNVQNSVTSNASKLSSIGNWTADKTNYVLTTTLTSIGNWTADKISYNTTAQLNYIYLNQTDQRYNDSTAISNVQSSVTSNASKLSSIGNWTNDKTSYALTTSLTSVGNWTADKTSYNTTAQLNYIYLNQTDQRYNDTTAIGTANTSMKNYADTTFYLKTNPNNYYNSTSIPAYALQTSLTSIGNWTADKTSYNTTVQLEYYFANHTDVTTANTSMKNYADNTFYLLTNPNGYYNVTTLPAGSGTLTGGGNTNMIAKWSTTTNLVNSSMSDNGTAVTIGTGITQFEVNTSGIYSSKNYTYLAGATPLMTPVNGDFYIWYANSTLWDCYNGSGTIYNRGNSTLTC